MGVFRDGKDDSGLLAEGTAITVRARVLREGSMGLSVPTAVAAAPDGTDLPVRILAGDHFVAGGGVSLRGDANGDGKRDLSDAIALLSCLLMGGKCPDASPAECAGRAS